MDKLSDRKKKIISSIVDNYIETALPVSSSEIQKKCMNECSSATIRNEMSALEEMGFLLQPHTSSGRIPSTKAYKYYVKNCINDSLNIDKKILKQISDEFSEKLNDMESLMTEAAKIISDKTNYTTILYKQTLQDLIIKEVKIVQIMQNKAIVVILTDKGLLHEKLINLPLGFTEMYINATNETLNKIFDGKKLSEIDKLDYKREINNKIEGFAIIFDQIYVMIKENINEKKEMILSGTEKIFDHKEYENIENVKHFLQIINEKDKLKDIMESQDEGLEISIKIGKDEKDNLENMALVSASYKINETEIVKAGVIGPERMDYKKVTEILSGIRQTLFDLLKDR